MDGRDKGIACGGIGVIHTLAKRIGLVKEIDKHLHLLKRHVPYHESDHVLNLAYNVLAGGEGFEDIELLRQDEGWMDALGAEIIPDPTTGGFVRRFSVEDVMTLMEVITRPGRRYGIGSRRSFLRKRFSTWMERSRGQRGNVRRGWIYRIRGRGLAPLIIR